MFIEEKDPAEREECRAPSRVRAPAALQTFLQARLSQILAFDLLFCPVQAPFPVQCKGGIKVLNQGISPGDKVRLPVVNRKSYLQISTTSSAGFREGGMIV